ncbi:MAG: hypothetical protein WAM53_02445, partial [Terrimicrobiaceae bacterium]
MESVAESGQGDLEPSEPSANGEPVRDEGDGQKSEKERDEKERKKERKQRMSGAKAMAGSFPMIELVAEQVRTSVPKEVIERVRGAKKKEIISSTYPYSKPMENEEYLEEIELLEIELVKMQAWVKETGDRIVILFEGRDAAGKGGTIKRFTENLNPRGARIVALTKPSETERGQWYFQRYVEQLPTRGELVFFDRSWYNRVGVEHIMGFCSAHEY